MERIFGEPQAGPSGLLSTPRIMPPKPSKSEMVQEVKHKPNMEKCLIGNREMQLPISLIEDPDVFKNVMSQHTWQTVLTDTQRKHLLKYLPSFPQNDVLQKQETLRKLFSGQNFDFGNPMDQFHEKLKDGWFSPDIAKYSKLYRKAKHKEYKYQQEVYYTNLLQDLIVNREKLLSAVYSGEPIKSQVGAEAELYAPPSTQRSIKKRVRDRYTKIVSEVKAETGSGTSLSSEDEDEDNDWSNDMKSMIGPLSPEPAEEDPVCKNMLATYASRPQFNGESGPERPRSPTVFTENSLKEIIRNHRKRRWNGEVLPDLDTKGITFHDILSRAQYFKKLALKLPSGSPGPLKKKVKVEKTESKKKKVKVKEEDEGKMAMLSVDDDIEDEPEEEGVCAEDVLDRSHDFPQEENAMDGTATSFEEEEDEASADLKKLQASSRSEMYNKPYKSFFCLLREFIVEEPESKTSTMKLEEKVREWQESSGPSLNPWAVTHPQWTELVSSALKFLSGDVIGLSIDNFIPLLDYKERAQQWKWIAKGRDSDEALTPLFNHWMQHKSDMATEAAEQGNASPLPPRSCTSYVVQTSSAEEKLEFREQEQLRFESPHKAFTYIMHGYESVVGPVKGVYSKDTTINKARDHALLIKDRPAYVTILTLVRDAAARLPNGEGTRSDICELLKDSHFLAPGVSDHQINTVVSGALDRLHYEKDPCVKYDVHRKLWIYLHRHRSEAEFEKIHQAQGAAAKAKKALQRTKPTKKGKETPVSTPSSLPSPSIVPTVSESLMMIEASNSSQGIATSARNGSASPRITPQLSPRATIAATKTVVSSSKVVTATLPQIQTSKAAQMTQVTTASTTSNSKTSLVQLSGSPQAKSVSLAFLQNATGGATRLPSQNATSVLATSGQVAGQQPRQTIAGSKPMAFSLIQASAGGKSVDQGGHNQTRTVLITSEGDKSPQKVVTVTQPSGASPALKVRETIAKLSQQVLSHQNAQAAAKAKQGIVQSATTQGTTTIKIQGSSILANQARSGKSAHEDRVQKVTQGSEVMAGHHEIVTLATSAHQQTTMLQKPLTQVALGRGGKPATLFITKPGSQPGTPTSVVATTLTGTETIAQLIQTSSLVGKPAVIGGKPIIIGGKPAVFSGKPIQLIQGKPGQFGVLQSNQASIVNLVSQHAGSAGTNVTVVSQAGTARIIQTSAGVSPTLVSQILQAGNPSILHPKGTAVTSHATMGSAKQVVTMATAHQQKLINQAKQNKAPTRLTAGTSLVGSQIIVTPSQTPTKFVASQIIAAGKRGGVVPTLITTQAGRPGQNIQVVKTVLSQANPGKPAQTTFVLAQPGGHPITSVTHDPKVVGSVKTGKPTGPVYARIITPPPGVRLAAVRPGQAMHGVSVLQAADGAQILTQYAPSAISTTTAQQVATKTESSAESQK